MSNMKFKKKSDNCIKLYPTALFKALTAEEKVENSPHSFTELILQPSYLLRNTQCLFIYFYTKKNELARVYLHTVHDTHALQVTICSHSTDDALHIFYADTVNQMCNF